MNPSDDQPQNWQYQPQDPVAEQPPVQNVPQDYPTETYQPTEQQPADEPTPVVDTPAQPTQPQVEEPPVQWTAREYVEVHKGVGWYAIFIVVALVLIAVDILWLKSITFSILVVVMSVALVIYANRPARDIQYTLSGRQGLYIGERLYHLSEFRAFGLIKDGEHNSIMLIPVKRFSPGVSVYFPEEAGEQIVDILGQRLPMETLKLDAIDVVVRKLRL